MAVTPTKIRRSCGLTAATFSYKRGCDRFVYALFPVAIEITAKVKLVVGNISVLRSRRLIML